VGGGPAIGGRGHCLVPESITHLEEGGYDYPVKNFQGKKDISVEEMGEVDWEKSPPGDTYALDSRQRERQLLNKKSRGKAAHSSGTKMLKCNGGDSARPNVDWGRQGKSWAAEVSKGSVKSDGVRGRAGGRLCG